MSRLALLCMFLCTIFAITFASPLPFNATATATAELAKRTNHYGTATYFDAGLGACGYHDTGSDHIVAMGINHYKGYCNRWIQVTNTDNGKTVTAKIRDLCESCADSNRIDMSTSAFSAIGAKSEGVLNVVWHYEAEGWSP
ncbi:hypothetical protein PILCRDRAFT_813101 [Piloderma croceum F 1598]|uniref:RlpA-like protein double-psi beta-barrel domain-containing protein n=1 Tax=Piloderma croceum (strain F 1598) TaxID=765440 RepID=A0A0C3GBU1_PILCF|nr:hypothetical protein PILCRDRAFT_813101 [Piloderma croceum F 1598]